jgi:hypothetical protein
MASVINKASLSNISISHEGDINKYYRINYEQWN